MPCRATNPSGFDDHRTHLAQERRLTVGERTALPDDQPASTPRRPTAPGRPNVAVPSPPNVVPSRAARSGQSATDAVVPSQTSAPPGAYPKATWINWPTLGPSTLPTRRAGPLQHRYRRWSPRGCPHWRPHRRRPSSRRPPPSPRSRTGRGTGGGRSHAVQRSGGRSVLIVGHRAQSVMNGMSISAAHVASTGFVGSSMKASKRVYAHVRLPEDRVPGQRERHELVVREPGRDGVDPLRRRRGVEVALHDQHRHVALDRRAHRRIGVGDVPRRALLEQAALLRLDLQHPVREVREHRLGVGQRLRLGRQVGALRAEDGERQAEAGEADDLGWRLQGEHRLDGRVGITLRHLVDHLRDPGCVATLARHDDRVEEREGVDVDRQRLAIRHRWSRRRPATGRVAGPWR